MPITSTLSSLTHRSLSRLLLPLPQPPKRCGRDGCPIPFNATCAVPRPERRVVALQAMLIQLRHSRSRFLNAVDALALVKPPTSSYDLTFPEEMTVPNRAIRRSSAAPTDCHPAIRLGEVVLVELKAQFGGVK